MTYPKNIEKAIGWIIQSKTDLSKKWWHRFLKVLFVVSAVVLFVFFISNLINSYDRITNQWHYVESLASRLNNPIYSGKVSPISQLYNDNEVVSDFKNMLGLYYYPSLEKKDILFPSSGMFLEDSRAKSFCSDELFKHIKDVARENKINLFSTVDPTFRGLFSDIDTFIAYLEGNSYLISCVTIDSYTLTKNATVPDYVFLRPVDTHDYSIFKYENGFLSFILAIFMSAAGLLLYVFGVMVIYYKIVLYVVYGSNKEK